MSPAPRIDPYRKGFTPLENAVLFAGGLSADAVRLYGALKHWDWQQAQRKAKKSYWTRKDPSLEILSRWTGLRVRLIVPARAELKDAGLLDWTPGGGRMRRSQYRLLPVPDLPIYEGETVPKRHSKRRDTVPNRPKNTVPKTTPVLEEEAPKKVVPVVEGRPTSTATASASSVASSSTAKARPSGPHGNGGAQVAKAYAMAGAPTATAPAAAQPHKVGYVREGPESLHYIVTLPDASQVRTRTPHLILKRAGVKLSDLPLDPEERDPSLLWEHVRKFTGSSLTATEKDWIEGQVRYRVKGRRIEWSDAERSMLRNIYVQRVLTAKR